MTDRDGTVRKEFNLLRLAPFAARAFALVDLRAQVLTVDGFGVGEIHRSSVAGEAADTHLGTGGILSAG